MHVSAWSKNWQWGMLKDHYQLCPECDGSGVEDFDPDDPPIDDAEVDECHVCRGERELRWGSFYAQDDGCCEECDDEKDKPISRMFDGCVSWVCIKCYVGMHSKECGCSLWLDAERDLEVARYSENRKGEE